MNNPWLRVQLRMGVWIEQGKWMPIPDINFNMSHLLLCHLVGRKPAPTSVITSDMHNKLDSLLGPHGYTYFRLLLAKRGEFVIPDKYVKEHKQYSEGKWL